MAEAVKRYPIDCVFQILLIFHFSVRDKYGPDVDLSGESSSSEEEDEMAQVSCSLNAGL